MISTEAKKQYQSANPQRPDYDKDALLKKFIEDTAQDMVEKFLQSRAFTTRKITDVPTDDLSVVNRGYVTNNGLSASRPNSAVRGQSFFDTTLGFPIWFDGAVWVNSQGNPV